MNLDTIAAEVRSCTRCPLHASRQHAVPGEGPQHARAMLVGEAPGAEEDRLGRPFAGRSGKVLDALLQEAQLERQELFITSVVKCRPPHNRVPHRAEIATCVGAHLSRQISVIRPQVICLLGGVAAGALLDESRLAPIHGKLLRREQLFLPTFHPAAAGRNPLWRAALAEDLKKLRKLLRQP